MTSCLSKVHVTDRSNCHACIPRASEENVQLRTPCCHPPPIAGLSGFAVLAVSRVHASLSLLLCCINKWERRNMVGHSQIYLKDVEALMWSLTCLLLPGSTKYWGGCGGGGGGGVVRWLQTIIIRMMIVDFAHCWNTCRLDIQRYHLVVDSVNYIAKNKQEAYWKCLHAPVHQFEDNAWLRISSFHFVWRKGTALFYCLMLVVGKSGI